MKSKAAEVMDGKKTILPDVEAILKMKELFDKDLKLIPKMTQRYSEVACFSELVDSVLMWSHYAANHTGFALGYDLRPLLNDSKWKNVCVFPIIYSENRYNASVYLVYQFLKMMNIPAHNPDITSSIKLMLYKSLDWQYEQEWRLIKSGSSVLPERYSEPIALKPNSIYYGCRISQEDRRRLHAIAQSKGIEEHSVSVDNACDAYMMSVSG